MADSALTKEQGLALLTKLAQDDAFRNHFEHKPAEALLSLAIPADVICRLPALCICPRKIGSKRDMEQARAQLAAHQANATLTFIIPSPKLSG